MFSQRPSLATLSGQTRPRCSGSLLVPTRAGRSNGVSKEPLPLTSADIKRGR